MATMRREAMLLLLLLVSFLSVPMTMGYRGGRGDEGRGEEEEEKPWEQGEKFLLQNSKVIVKTEGGEMRVVRSYRSRGVQNPVHIGFINMEPKTLFIPQYTDCNLILLVSKGEVKIGKIHKDKLVEKQLKAGDIYSIPAGFAFYMENTGKGQRLQIICGIDTSESLRLGVFQSFFIGGGVYPRSVLAGFDRKTLTRALNISEVELEQLLSSQTQGPIAYITASHEPRTWASLMQLTQQQRQEQLGKKEEEDDDADQQEEQSIWSWRKLLRSVFDLGKENNENKIENGKKTVDDPDSYHLYDKKPDFKNNYGWSVAVDENDYSPLKSTDISVYYVNLTAGSMMAPHVNPTATEYGIVLTGSGRIEIVYPNGSSAMNAEVEEGDVFWIPRYFPFCHVASVTGPMEFFGFTTSARTNRPQFLVGANSILSSMKGDEMATAFGISVEEFRNLTQAQHDSVILPATQAAPRGYNKESETKKEEEGVYAHPLMRSVGPELIMGFD